MNTRHITRTTALVAALAAVFTLATPAQAGLLGQGGGSLGGSFSRGGLDGTVGGQGRLEATRPELRRPAAADRATAARERLVQTGTTAAGNARDGAAERAGDAADRGRGALSGLGQRAGSAGAGIQAEASGSGQAAVGGVRRAEMPGAATPTMPATPAVPATPGMGTSPTTPATPAAPAAPATPEMNTTPATPAPASPAPTSADAGSNASAAPSAQASGRRGRVTAEGDGQARASRQGGSAQVQAQGSARASAERR